MNPENVGENNYHETIVKGLKNEDEKQLEDSRHEQALKNIDELENER